MKYLVILTTVGLLVTACDQKQQPQAAQAPAQPAKPQVTGAFGFTLGQPIPAELNSKKPDKNGYVWFSAKEPLPVEDGGGGFAAVDQNGLVYEIQANIFWTGYWTNSSQDQNEAKEKFAQAEEATLLALREKYGNERKNSLGDPMFGQEPNVVSLRFTEGSEMFTINYKNEELSSRFSEYKRATEKAAVEKTKKGLSGL